MSGFPPARIDSFRGNYRFLSNFWRCTIPYMGERFPSLEHAYQAAKCSKREDVEYILTARTPGVAKARGRAIVIRPGWEEIKVGVMRELVLLKFSIHKDLSLALIDTYPAELIEGNDWGDRFWGVCNGEGLNWLGRILMEVRQKKVRP